MIKQEFTEVFRGWISEYFEKNIHKKNFVELLFKSQEYSLKSNGKRFRPVLASTVYQIWQTDLSLIKNFCLAIEMIHTYSLIHDDLPCMDNDNYRRGVLTNHKIFGEDIALLAGDSLLTDAIFLISSDKNISPEVRVRVIELLTEKIGSLGMVGGQVLDMKSNKEISFEQLQQMHLMKTACLIEISAMGAALIANAKSKEVEVISKFSQHLGLAFQIKDDLLDYKDDEQDFKNYVSVIGFEETKQKLIWHTNQALEQLNTLNQKSLAVQDLRSLIIDNQKRNF